jgi:hypothetical protein
MYNSYERYGDPYKLAEFRMLVLNDCSMDCRGCFYNRTKNNYNDFTSSLSLAKDLLKNGYELETCYLLPTDIFDNKDNYKLFENAEFAETVSLFEYVGVASTLETGFDPEFFKIVKNNNPLAKIELQVNLLIAKLFDINYQITIKSRIAKIKETYGDDVIINLAINTGFTLSDKEKVKLNQMLDFLSDDEIIELNFTFLYNPDISLEKKTNMLQESIRTIHDITDHYLGTENATKQYNDRTLLRKPAFTFLGSPGDIFLTPIIPFDEYVFIDNPRFRVLTPNYEGFIKTYSSIDDINNVILDKCVNCKNLTHCMGKGYFPIARDFNMGCFLDIK